MTEILEHQKLLRVRTNHNLRMRQIDVRMAPRPLDSGIQMLVAAEESGNLAVGRFKELRYEAHAYEALWGALRRYVLNVCLVGADPAAVFDNVIRQLLDEIGSVADHDPDQAVILTWPSLDTACAAPLIARGFVPLTSLVIADLHRHDPPARVQVRPALNEDLDWLADQAEQLHRFEMQLGALPMRTALRARLKAELAEALIGEIDFVLIAEEHGVPVGFVHGQLPHGAWIEQQIADGPAGYLSRLFVAPQARRKSVGRSLITAAHNVLRENTASVGLLHHSLHNPLAAPLWAQAGYRPLLTTWVMAIGT